MSIPATASDVQVEFENFFDKIHELLDHISSVIATSGSWPAVDELITTQSVDPQAWWAFLTTQAERRLTDCENDTGAIH